jgi:hypothetical protein
MMRIMFRSPLLAALVLTACGASEATVAGEIDDDEIRLGSGSGPAEVWFELENVGTQPCSLVPMLAPNPADLPVEDDKVVMSLRGDTALPEPMEAYTELNGEPYDRGEGTITEAGWVTVVAPGDRVRLQVAFEAVPDVGERVLVCNDAGDYASGRFAVLPFDR